MENASWVQGCGVPPLPSIYPHRCECSDPVPCKMMQEQWRALEQAYQANLTRAIGVSNYCQRCLACIVETAHVAPHVNMIELHVGMTEDPSGLVSATKAAGAAVQAYRPLGSGDHGLFAEAAVVAAAQAHGKTAAQVLLKWAVTLGHAVVTSTTNPEYMKQDLDLWGWQLSADEMAELNSLANHTDDPTGEMCVLGNREVPANALDTARTTM